MFNLKLLLIMKKIYLSMIALAIGAFSANAGIQITFDGNNNLLWNAGDNATTSDGHLVVPMAEQANGKYRQDLSFNNADNAYTLDASADKVLAVKFIGTRPNGNMTLEFQNDGTWLNSKWKNRPDGSVTTSAGNTIYYYDLTKDEAYTGVLKVNRMGFKIADCTEAPYEYTLDWIKSYSSVDAIEADKDWKDDGANDTDEANVVASPVQIEGKSGYSTLADAWAAAVTGDVIVLNENQTISGSRLNTLGRNLTIKAGEASTITRGDGFTALLFLTNSGDIDGETVNGVLTLEGITVDNADIETGVSFEASGNGTLNLRNVELVNFNSNNNQGIVSVKNGGHANLENVSVSSSTVPEGRGEIFAGTNSVTLTGDNSLSLYVEKVLHVNAIDVTNTTPITIYVDANRDLETGAELVSLCTDPSKFTVGTPGFQLVAGETGLNIVKETESAIAEIGAAVETVTAQANGSILVINAPAAGVVDVYGVDGRIVSRVNVVAGVNTVDNLAPGIYIVARNKVAIR